MGAISLSCSSARSAASHPFSSDLLIIQVDLSDSSLTNFSFQGYEVHGIKRHASTFNQSRIEHLFMHGLDQKIQTGSRDAASSLKLHMHYGDVLDINSLVSVFLKVRPDEIYNLAAQSHVRTSFDMPVYVSLAAAHSVELMQRAAIPFSVMALECSIASKRSDRLFHHFCPDPSPGRHPFLPHTSAVRH